MATAKYDPNDGRLRGRALQARRLRIWRADPHCQMCGRLVSYPDGFELDHIEHFEKSRNDDEENTQVLCHTCHLKKTAKDMGVRYRVPIGADGFPLDSRGQE